MSEQLGIDVPSELLTQFSQETADILEQSVDDLDVDSLVSHIPLALRLSRGVDYTKEIARRQRDLSAEQASCPDGLSPNDVRLDVDNFGVFSIRLKQAIEADEKALQDLQELVESKTLEESSIKAPIVFYSINVND